MTGIDFVEFLHSRSSIRQCQDAPIPKEIIMKLLEAGRLAPSRGNSQPWKFIVVTDSNVRKDLAIAAYDQKLVENFPLAIVILGIIDPRKENPDRTAELVEVGAFGQDVKDFADCILDDWDQQELKVDAALNSSIAATHIMLAAHAFGLGCCWVKLCQDDEVLKILGVPEGYYHTGILSIGYPDQNPKPRPRIPLGDMVFHNRFGNPCQIE